MEIETYLVLDGKYFYKFSVIYYMSNLFDNIIWDYI